MAELELCRDMAELERDMAELERSSDEASTKDEGLTKATEHR